MAVGSDAYGLFSVSQGSYPILTEFEMKSSTNLFVRNLVTIIIIAVVVTVAVAVVPGIIAAAKEVVPNCSGIVC